MAVHTQVDQNARSHTQGSKAPVPSDARPIIDIRRDREELDLQSDIYRGLKAQHGNEKYLPTLLLYDELGLKLFEDITYLEEYYLTNTEIEVLEKYAHEIAQNIKSGSILLELGSGNLRKVDILLRAVDRLGKRVEYYALDLSLIELERTLAAIPPGTYTNVECFGLHGTYDDGLEWLKTPLVKSKPKLVLSLGSSIGNFPRPDAADFIRGFADVLQPTDKLLMGIDGCTDPKRVFHAYNDREGVTHRFVANGLKNANRICGKEMFDLDAWAVIGEFNEAAVRHQAFVSPKHDTEVDGILVRKGERVKIEESNKYTDANIRKLWHSAAVVEKTRWANQRGDYALYMISKNNFRFPLEPEVYASGPVPSWLEWNHLSSLWDVVTRKMIPDDGLLDKPIKLRNACIFYLGHIPTFLDITLADATDGVLTEPASYRGIFERGIDPDVDNPERCHEHSEIPDTWPPLEDILGHHSRVRNRVKHLYNSGLVLDDPKVSRAMWLGYEHECMHLETLLYMLIQSEKTLPPLNIPMPDFKAVAERDEAAAVPNEWITVPENDIVLGLHDPETSSGPARYFGWDVEKPPRKAHVPSFTAKARPITIGEYVQYLEETGKTQIPASWTEAPTTNGHAGKSNGHNNGHTNGQTNGQTNGHTNGHANGVTNGTTNVAHTNGDSKPNFANKSFLSVWGPIPLAHVLHWPVTASYDELAGCATWMGGRIPTLEEAQSIYSHVDRARSGEADNSMQKTIPAVNSQMINEGVEETPPQGDSVPSAATGHASNGNGVGGTKHTNGNITDQPNPRDSFVDLRFCNVGFQQWVPSPVTQNGNRLSGQSDMGGVWEWTSSPLRKHEGFEPMPMYPAYSRDFFDEKHNIVLGGSWATVPRLAGRKSFVNWYQRNYPYVWAGARVVRDL